MHITDKIVSLPFEVMNPKHIKHKPLQKMKKQTISLLATLLTASIFFFSCSHSANKGVGALKFDTMKLNETVHLFGDTTKPACNLVVDYTYVAQSADETLKDTLNAYFQALCLGSKYAAMQPAEAVDKYAENYTGNYRRDLEPMYQKDEQEHPDRDGLAVWYYYYKKIESSVQHYEKNLLVYRSYYEEFTGGAHGIYTTSFLNIDLRTMTPIRLDDLFVSDYREALTDLLWNQLMMDKNAATREEVEDLGYCSTGDLYPSENFYLSKEGITFYYNVYDIAPYVMGAIEITLPYDIMAHLLSDDNQIISDL